MSNVQEKEVITSTQPKQAKKKTYPNVGTIGHVDHGKPQHPPRKFTGNKHRKYDHNTSYKPNKAKKSKPVSVKASDEKLRALLVHYAVMHNKQVHESKDGKLTTK